MPELPYVQHVCDTVHELLLYCRLLRERCDALDRRDVHAGSGGRVPGDDERWINIVYDERHDDQLSGGDRLRGRDVHVNGWAGLVQQLRRQQLLEHGGRWGDELHGLSDEQCGVSRPVELLL